MPSTPEFNSLRLKAPIPSPLQLPGIPCRRGWSTVYGHPESWLTGMSILAVLFSNPATGVNVARIF